MSAALRSAGISRFVANSSQPLFINEKVTVAYFAFNRCNVVWDENIRRATVQTFFTTNVVSETR
jgi:hypothetical protein